MSTTPVHEAPPEAIDRQSLPIITRDLLAKLGDAFQLTGVDDDGGLTLHISGADVLRLAPRQSRIR